MCLHLCMKVMWNLPPLHGVVCDHFWGGGHGWPRASAAIKARPIKGSVQGETLLGYLPSYRWKVCSQPSRYIQSLHHSLTDLKDTEVCLLPCLFKKEIVEWFCLFFHGRAVLKFMCSLKVRKTCLNPECSGSCLACTCHVIRLNVTQRVTVGAKTTNLLACQSVAIAVCERDPSEIHSSLC